jgi:hypothetical protein
VRADDQGNFSPLVWRMLWFDGRSVLHLRRDLAAELGVGEANVLDITMCVRAGSNGRLTPLVIDLPFDEQAMDIVVLATDSPGNLCSPCCFSSHYHSDENTYSNTAVL